MKQFSVTAIFTLILFVLLSATTACTSPSAGYLPPISDPSASQTSLNDLRTYYEAIIDELKQELSLQKQENYVTQKEYESRIAELESQLERTEADPPDTDIPVSAPAESDLPESTSPHPSEMAFHYVIKDEKAVILAYTGHASAVVIPEKIFGYPVGRIEDDAFRGSAVTSITVPDTVIEIGWFAFADCPNLTSVTLPSSVTSIGYGAFDGCHDLTVYCPANSYAATYAISFALRIQYI